MPKQSTNVSVSPATMRYYAQLESVLKASGRYAQVYKLRQNLDDPDTSWKVQRILDDYYGGNIQKLESTIKYRLESCVTEIEYLGKLCKLSGQIQNVDAKAFAKLLLNEARRAAYKKMASGYKKRNLIVPLQDFETEYKGS